MKTIAEKKRDLRRRRTLSVRKHLKGTASKPRLCVVKTNEHIYAQLIDDEKGCTLGSTSTLSKAFRKTETNKKNKESAAKLGVSIAEIASQLQIQEVIFDRGPFRYGGILAALADAARGAGLKF